MKTNAKDIKKEKSKKTLRYAKDPVFRSKVLHANTLRYRRKAVKVRNCLVNLKGLAKFGTRRKCVSIMGTGEVITAKSSLTFSVAEMSKLLGYHPVVMYGWHSAEKFPRPKVHVMGPANKLQTVYTEAQAIALLKVMGEHQQSSQYLRDFDTETIGKLKAAMAAE